jgi:putative ABC transport system permease protein
VVSGAGAPADVLTVTLRDLQWRARRVVLGLVAAGLVLAMTVLMGAVHDSFLTETDRAVRFFGADSWVVPTGISGPFTTNSPTGAATVTAVRAASGVIAASPVAIFRHVVRGAGPGYSDVNVIAYPPGGVVVPRPVEGRGPTGPGEVSVDRSLHVAIGATLRLAGRPLQVVGEVNGLTYNGGTPTILLTLSEAQDVAFGGQPLASAIVVRGAPRGLTGGLRIMTPTEVRDDLRRPLSVATSTLGLLAVLLWVVAAGIVGFVCYLSGLDRSRDLAVFKAVGVTTARLVASVLVEGVLMSLAAAAVAFALSSAFLPVFPLDTALTGAACLRLLAVALVIGLAASAASVRQAVRVDPATAFANT